MKRFAVGLILVVLMMVQESWAGITVAELLCDRMERPMGVDTTHPELSWKLVSDERGQKQTAYQVLVASSPKLLANDDGDLWDSGKILSDHSFQVAYGGTNLGTLDRCFWKVRVWDVAGKASKWSSPAEWTMGVIKTQDWRSRWIAGTNAPTLLLRRGFPVKAGLNRAVVAICGLGYYHLTFNGNPATPNRLTPGWTKYDKTCLYDVYEVTRLLSPGQNMMGVVLGNGMYDTTDTSRRYAKFKKSFGPKKVIAQLRLEYADGTLETIDTDEQWRVHAGPTTFASVFGGEDYDARLALPGWDQPGFDSKGWAPAEFTPGPGGILRGLSYAAPPVRTFDVFKPVKTTVIKPGLTVYDFGQNASQVFTIQAQGPAGASIRISPAELLNEDGTVYQESIGTPTWCRFTLKGSGRETWQPQFFYCGYRYLRVETLPATPNGAMPRVDALESTVLHTAAAPIGEFATSNVLINRIYQLVRWAQRSNLQSIMTDCPHREKLGWLEQTHLNGPALRYNYDLTQFFNKVMNDMADSQTDDGLIPNIAPEYPVFTAGFRDSPEWGSAIAEVAWNQYQFAGDLTLLRRYYDAIARYVEYLDGKAKAHIVSHGLGDWRQLTPTPKALTATAFYYHDTWILAQAAQLLGKTNDAVRYRGQAEEIHEAFNKKFFNATNHLYATGSQSSLAIPLDMNLVLEEERKLVFEKLVGDLKARGLTAGEIGFPSLLRVLAREGRSDAVFTMINETNRPGYGFMLNYGATSLPEDWDYKPKSSQNHFMLGHINEWFYHDVVGIQCDPAGPGFKKIIIKPTPVGDLTWVKGSYDSVRGKISSAWEKRGERFDLRVEIPVNTTATVFIPAKDAQSVTEGGQPVAKAKGVKLLRTENGAAVFAVESGSYRFQSKLNAENTAQ